MKKKYRNVLLVFLILSLLFVVGCVVNEYNKTTPDIPAMLQNIFMSIICSIVASILFCMLQMAISNDDQEDLKEIKEEVTLIEASQPSMNQLLLDIDEKLKKQNELYDSGIRSIRKKSYYDRDGKFWNDIIEATSGRLDLVGHSISKWFDEEYKSTFVAKIDSMLRNGKEVRIILSGAEPDRNKISQAEKDFSQRIHLNKMEMTCFELRQIVKKVPKALRHNLLVYLADPIQVTYLYIRTDHQCFISPYIYSTNNNSNSFLLELETRIDYSKCFEQDFSELLTHIDKINLEG